MSNLKETYTHAGKNPAIGSDRVKAPVADADPFGCGRVKFQADGIEGGGGPQAANKETGKREKGSGGMVTEEAAFGRSQTIKRTPPPARKNIFRADRSTLRERAGSAGDLSMVQTTVTVEDLKRKNFATQCEEGDQATSNLADLVKNLLDGIKDLTRTVASAANTRRDVVACVSNLDTMAKKFSDGKLEAMVEELETKRAAKTIKMATQKVAAKTATCEVGTQWPEPGMVWGKPARPKFTYTKIVEGSPLTLGSEWDLAVLRAKADPKMDLGIQHLFKTRFEGIAEQEGDVVQIMTATWISGKEPVKRTIYRIDDGDPKDLRRRAEEVLSDVAKNNRKKIALPWDDQLSGKLEEIRVMWEETAAKHKVEVSIHTKPKGKGKEKESVQTRRANTDAILVKKAEGATYASTLRMVREEVKSKGLGETIRGVRESKSGDLVLTVTRKPDGGETGLIKEALQTRMGKGNVRAPKQKPEGVVHIKDIEVDATPDDVKKAIERGLGHKEGANNVQVASLRKGFAGTQNATVYLQKEDEERLLNLKVIRIGLPSCRIVRNKQITTCFRCWDTGHTQRTCNGPDRSKKCRNCGKEGHFRKDCKEESVCAICNTKGHPANTTRCPAYQKALANPERKAQGPEIPKKGPAKKKRKRKRKPRAGGRPTSPTSGENKTTQNA